MRSPGLVRQVVNAAKDVGIPLLGENALEGGIYNPEVFHGQHFNTHISCGQLKVDISTPCPLSLCTRRSML